MTPSCKSGVFLTSLVGNREVILVNKVDGVSRKFKRVSPFVNFPALGVKCSISIMDSTNADELSC